MARRFLYQKFGQDFLEDKLKPFYKSEPVPEKVKKSSLPAWSPPFPGFTFLTETALRWVLRTTAT